MKTLLILSLLLTVSCSKNDTAQTENTTGTTAEPVYTDTATQASPTADSTAVSDSNSVSGTTATTDNAAMGSTPSANTGESPANSR